MRAKSNPVVAIACADFHLSENAPVARSAESSWWDAMRRPLAELRDLQARHDCPILFCGDLFDIWNPRPAVINFALEELPKMFGISGNHDTPFHNPDLIGQSAYWTMVTTGKIIGGDATSKLDLSRFPFGTTPIGINAARERLQVALIHAYAWCGDPEGPYEKPESNIGAFDLMGYDAVFFGDNHKGWSLTGEHPKHPNVMNCGCLLRRKANEKEYIPGVGLLRADGSIERYELDTSADRWIENIEEIVALETETGLDLSGFVDGLKQLAPGNLDFRDEVNRYMDDNCIGKSVRKIILKAIDGFQK